MANFDMAVGVTLTAFNSLLAEYYADPPASLNPFTGNQTKSIAPFGSINLTWQIKAVPTITFGPPSLAIWNAALNNKGATNQSAGTPLPTASMVQLNIPTMQAYYSINSGPLVGGTTSNVTAYATITFSGADITITLAAITLDESDFKIWDKAIFNSFFIPEIFKAVQSILAVIHIPNLSYQGVSLAIPQFFFINNSLLVAATIVTTNPNALDISGVTWPTNNMFALASSLLINAGLTAFGATLIGKSYSGSGVFHALGSDLADYNYSVTLTTISANWTASTPLTVTASVTGNPSFGGSLTAAGMALAVTAGCALCSGQNQMQPGPY